MIPIILIGAAYLIGNSMEGEKKFAKGGKVKDYSGKYYDLKNFIEKNKLQKKFVEQYNEIDDKITIKNWYDYTRGELGSDEEIIKDLSGKEYRLRYSERDDEFTLTKKQINNLVYKIVFSEKKYNKKVIDTIEDTGIYSEYEPRFVVLLGDKVIGGSTYEIDEYNTYHFDLGVIEEYQGYGISKELINRIISDAKELKADEVNAFVVNEMLFEYLKSIKFNFLDEDGQQHAWKNIK
jgi:GNAT superfamily N-acetyltransferase